MQLSPRIWGLLDDKAGHANQVRGLIEALSIPTQTISLTYNRWAALPNALLGATMCHLRGDTRAELKEQIAQNIPTLVIACGRRTEPVARYIKRMHPNTRMVYIMRPANMKGWDAMIIPAHDKPPKNDPRIIASLMPLHRVNDAAIAQAKMRYEQLFAHLPHPRIGVLIGDIKDIAPCVTAMEKIAGQEGSLLITTSRRTAPHIAQMLRDKITFPHHFYDAHAQVDADNPYMGILAYADVLIVSGDSLSMCAEAVATGKPVYIDDSDNGLSKKHRAMHRALYEKGCAKPLSQALQQEIFLNEPSREIEKIAAQLRARFLS